MLIMSSYTLIAMKIGFSLKFQPLQAWLHYAVSPELLFPCIKIGVNMKPQSLNKFET